MTARLFVVGEGKARQVSLISEVGAKDDAVISVRNSYEMVTKLFELSKTGSRKDHATFSLRGRKVLFYRNPNFDRTKGGWVHQSAMVSSSFIDRSAVVMGRARVEGSTIEEGVVVQPGEKAFYTVLRIGGLLRG